MSTVGSFASDNNAGIHPEILKAIAEANIGHVPAYGKDIYTRAAESKFKEYFGENSEVFFVFNGTAANVLGLKAVTHSHHAIICADTAHINTAECGAPEYFTGCKLVAIPTEDGKIRQEMIDRCLRDYNSFQFSKPKVVSLTQCTELGTVYTIEEIRTIADFAHKNGLILHMDGARLANAAAYLQNTLKQLTYGAGVDVLSFGGTKNGLMLGEAIVFFNRSLSQDFQYIRKQGMHLSSKMRFISIQFDRLLSNDLWLNNAKHANAMAQLLSQKLTQDVGLTLTQKVETNAVFAKIPLHCAEAFKKTFEFNVWNDHDSTIRWLTSFDTTPEDVEQLIHKIKDLLASTSRVGEMS